MHAINNVLGERVCTQPLLEETLRLMAFEAQFPDAENVPAEEFNAARHMNAAGNYSEELLAKFLETHTAFRLEFVPLTPDSVQLLRAGIFHAALVHVPGHWVSFQWRDEAWVYFDSLKPGPEVWTTADVQRLLRRPDVRALPLRLLDA
jgi:hypothetical protein